jgi:ABC-type transport system substrate-binding protein
MADAAVSRWVAHPRAKVWRALADPVVASLWLPFEGYEPRVGARFFARSPAGLPPARCEVLVIEPERRVVVAWHSEGHASRLTVELTSEGGGTRISICHQGLPELRALWVQVLEEPFGDVLRGLTRAPGPWWGRWGVELGGLGVVALGLVAMTGWKVRQPVAPAPLVEEELAAPSPALHPPDGVLDVYEQELPTTLNPLLPRTAVDRRVHALIFDTLFSPDSPLVTQFERGPRQLRVTLDRDVHFHDGAPVTAEDVCFSVQAVLDPGTPSTLGFRERGDLLGCEVLDTHVAELQLREDTPPDLALLAIPVLPRHAFDAAAFATAPIGTGPYRGRKGRLQVNLWAHEGAARVPGIERIVITIGGDALIQARTLLAGGVDGIVSLHASMIGEIARSREIALESSDAGSILYLGLDPDTLVDPQIRQAIELALDRKELCRWALRGDLDGSLTPCRRLPGTGAADPARAEALLRQVGGAPFLRLGSDPSLSVVRDGLALQLEAVGFLVVMAAGEEADLWVGRGSGLPLWGESTISAWRVEVTPRPITPGTYWGEVERWRIEGRGRTGR